MHDVGMIGLYRCVGSTAPSLDILLLAINLITCTIAVTVSVSGWSLAGKCSDLAIGVPMPWSLTTGKDLIPWSAWSDLLLN